MYNFVNALSVHTYSLAELFSMLPHVAPHDAIPVLDRFCTATMASIGKEQGAPHIDRDVEKQSRAGWGRQAGQAGEGILSLWCS